MIAYIKKMVRSLLKDRDLYKGIKHVGYSSHIDTPAIISGKEYFSVGDYTTILSHARIQTFSGLVEKPEIIIGDHCYVCYYFTILNASQITIGNNVLIASHVLISSENHGVDPESETPYMNQQLQTKPVSIDDGCWIGEKVCILPGVHIGKKCIIGAASVVTKSIPDYCMAAGNPAKVIKKYNFTTHQWEKI